MKLQVCPNLEGWGLYLAGCPPTPHKSPLSVWDFWSKNTILTRNALKYYILFFTNYETKYIKKSISKILLRFMVGFNIGCVPQSVTLYAEFLPNKQRGKCVVLLDCFWALGKI